MDTARFTVFDTAVGRCGMAWGAHGVLAVQLPQPDLMQTRARLLRRAPGAIDAEPGAEVQRAIHGVVALLRGEPVDLGFVQLDLNGIGDFERRVYAVTRSIPPGRTLSYGEVAERLGDRALARAVGQALARNPFAPVVPCHRVLAAQGRMGGFSAAGGVATKLRLLQIEAALSAAQPGLFDDDLAQPG